MIESTHRKTISGSASPTCHLKPSLAFRSILTTWTLTPCSHSEELLMLRENSVFIRTLQKESSPSCWGNTSRFLRQLSVPGYQSTVLIPLPHKHHTNLKNCVLSFFFFFFLNQVKHLIGPHCFAENKSKCPKYWNCFPLVTQFYFAPVPRAQDWSQYFRQEVTSALWKDLVLGKPSSPPPSFFKS